MVGAFVRVPTHAAAVSRVERFDTQDNFVVFHGASTAAVRSQRIRFTSPHGNRPGVATCDSWDSKHGMSDQNKAVVGDPVPHILRQWLQTWRPCFTAPSWEHVLVLVMGGLLATGKRTVRLRTHSQNRTVAARATAERKVLGHLS